MVEEFYKWVMVEATNIKPQSNNQFKKVWFLNRLKKKYTKHIHLMLLTIWKQQKPQLES